MKEKKQNVTRYNSSIFAQKVRLKHDFVVLCLFSFILIDVSMKEQQLREKKKRRTDISRSKRKKNCKSSKTLQLSLPFILFSGQVTSNNITKKRTTATTMSEVAKLFDGHIINKAHEEVDLNDGNYQGKIIGLYFSAHWFVTEIFRSNALIEIFFL